MNKLPFKISASLKNIIGKDLITDDYIAVFELVKNSYDAHATHVQIIFEEDTIIIRDDGKGMDYNDIINRWLFVAYSAKKEGVEDNELEKEELKDYRDKISRKKFFAGAKGIGRFSCDKLGKHLRLITKKITKDSNFEEIKVNWEDFEQDTNKEFVNISVEHNTLNQTNYENFKHGTILEISGLNSNWDREKKLNLKHSLEKLINPIESEKSQYSFSVKIIDHNEEQADKKEKIERNKVNGFVKNFVFETLKLKTTHISTKINSKKIITELNDRGKKLYEIEEENTFDEIDDLTIKLFYLNRKAKYNFTQKMGVRNREFGSIFLYKNGIRIYPYGDPKEDFFGIDRRRAQGWKRFLGTRDLLGRLELFDSKDKFKETTSRDGGLVENESFNQLVNVFFEKCFYRLEQYVVGVQWQDVDESDKDTEDTSKLDNITAKTKIINIISKLANSKDITRIIHYDKDFLNIINEKVENLSPHVFKELETIAEKGEDTKFKNRIQIAKQQYDKVVKEKEEAERKRKEAERKQEEAERKAKEQEEARKRAEKEKDQRVNQVRFLQSIKSVEYEDVRNLNHIIGLKSDLINKQIKTIKKKIDKDNNLSKEEIFKFLKSISLANSQITTITRFTTKGNFLQASQDTTDNIVKFIINYIENIYTKLFTTIKTKYINKDIEFNYHFVPIDITMVLDNIISNSRKAKADIIEIEFKKPSEKELIISFRDNGKNLDPSINNPNIIFEEGFTTTNGSGLGLSHVKKVIDEMKGEIKINPNNKDKFELIIKLHR
ncbi:MAG: ATP-binding protein [Candidatus Woesearchaeota archaeon]